MKILHIESSKMIKMASRHVIEGLNHDYFEASNMEEAMIVLADEELDLIITGLELEDMDGKMVVRRLALSEYNSIPIVVLTATDDFETRKELFELGIVDYQLKKNFDKNRLKEYIKSIELGDDLIESLKRSKVAVVDDSEITITIIRNIFELNDIKDVDYYYDSSSLMDSPLNYDIYIIDLVLPETSGESLISKIKGESMDNVIIMISSTNNYKTISHALNSGADDYIVKPFDANTFLVRIKSHLKNHMLVKALEESNERLRLMSITDGLTGLYNHKFILKRLEEEVHRAERYDRKLSIILLDIDNFKSVNDTYGHIAGDEVLEKISKDIMENLRDSDVVGRYGGEEFLLVLPNTDLTNARIVGNKIRNSIKKLTFNDDELKVTISGGVSEFSSFDYSTMIKEADSNLYQAKRNGKDQIV